MEIINDNGNDSFDMGDKQPYEKLIDGRDIRYKTEITDEQKYIMASMESSIDHFAQKGIDLRIYKQYLKTFIDMGASVGRQSRKEIVESFKARSEEIERERLADKQASQLQ